MKALTWEPFLLDTHDRSEYTRPYSSLLTCLLCVHACSRALFPSAFGMLAG